MRTEEGIEDEVTEVSDVSEGTDVIADDAESTGCVMTTSCAHAESARSPMRKGMLGLIESM